MTKTILYQYEIDGEVQNKRIVLSSLLKNITKDKTVINTNVKKYRNYPNPYKIECCFIYDNKRKQNTAVLMEINEYLINNKKDKGNNMIFKGIREIDYNYFVFDWNME
jgi:hypothetical protein